MLCAMSAAIALFLARRDRAAGALMVVAAGIKVTGLLVLPFMVVAARGGRRRLRVITGAVLAAIPLAAMSFLLFGATAPNVSDQTQILTPFSIPNLVGLALGVGGGTHGVIRDLQAIVIVVAVYQLLRLLIQRDRDWLAAAGWTTVALIASASWLMPWYMIWLLPLAALARRPSLRVMAVALTLFLVLTLGPDTTYVLGRNKIDLLNTPAGRASNTLEHKLTSGPQP
jgi:alpha-1,6-mannosyltransferase